MKFFEEKVITKTTKEEVVLNGTIKVSEMNVNELSEFLKDNRFFSCVGVECNTCPLAIIMRTAVYNGKKVCDVLLEVNATLRKGV